MCFQCCAGVHKTKPCKLGFFILTLVSNSAGIVANWCLYTNLRSYQKGLVYGPLSDDILRAILAFAVISSVLFLAELVNSLMNCACDRKFMNEDLFSAIDVWFGELPLSILNVLVAACREELVSDFQIAKGAVVMGGALVRFLILMVRYCSKKNLREMTEKSAESCRNVTWRGLVVFGVILTSACSVLIFIFALYHFNDGKLIPNDPSRHFQNVGIFVHEKSLALPGNQWIKISDIEAVKSREDSHFRFLVRNTGNKSALAIADNLMSAELKTRSCFVLNTTNDACADLETGGNNYLTIFRFHYMAPVVDVFASSQIFGDIYFNVERRFPDTAVYNSSESYIPRYYQYPSTSNQTQFAYPLSSLTEIQLVWSNGFFKCESSGSLFPNKDINLLINGSYFIHNGTLS